MALHKVLPCHVLLLDIKGKLSTPYGHSGTVNFRAWSLR